MQVKVKEKRFWSNFLLLLWSPIILFSLFIFIGHGFEPIIDALHLREMNEQKEPLSVGEVWEEEFFVFSLENVSEFPSCQWDDIFPSEYDDSLYTAYELEFAFLKTAENKYLGEKFDLYACNRDEFDKTISCPMPANTIQSMTADDSKYYILASNGTEYIDVIVRIPYGKERYYKQTYRFWTKDIK